MRNLIVMIVFNVCLSYKLGWAQWSGSKIIGGRTAYPGELPATVCVTGSIRCGGTLVHLDKVLTAGHCFTSDNYRAKLTDFVIIGGSVNIRDKGGGYQESGIESYKLHKKYKETHLFFGKEVKFDIAVAILDTPFMPSETLKPAVFVSSDPKQIRKMFDKLVAAGTKCIGTGWGFTSMNSSSKTSDELKIAELKVLKKEECMVSIEMANFEVCTLPVSKDEHTAVGDSGSSFLCDGYVYGMTKGAIRYTLKGKRYKVFIFTLIGPHLDHFDITVDHSQNLRFPVTLILLSLAVLFYCKD